MRGFITVGVIAALVLLSIVAVGGSMLFKQTPTEPTSEPIVSAFGDPLVSLAVGTDPDNGDCLTTNGATSTWGSCSGEAGANYWNDAGTYLYPKDGDYIQAPRFTATSTTLTSTFPLASTTALTSTRAFLTQLANLTSNGFVKVGSSNGTLSVDTTTYESGLTAGDALTRTGNDFDFDGGATPGGSLGGTWASPTVDDDGHAHTGTTLSGIDISSDTNLSGDTEIVLTGDALSIGAAIARDSEINSIVSGTTTLPNLSILESQISDLDHYTNADASAYITGSSTILKSTAIGVSVQAYDADLTTYAGITPSANVQSLLSAASYAAMRTLLDLEAGTDFYSISAADTAFEGELDNSAGLLAALSDETGTSTAVFSGSPTILNPTLTSYFGTPCTGNEFLQDISDTGAFTCAEAAGGGGGGALSTTTDIIGAGGLQLVSYVLGDTMSGGSSSTTAEFLFDDDGAQFIISSTTANATSSILSVQGALTLGKEAGEAIVFDFNTANQWIVKTFTGVTDFVLKGMNLVIDSGKNFTIGSTQWNSGDNIDIDAVGGDTTDNDDLDIAAGGTGTSTDYFRGESSSVYASSTLALDGSYGAAGTTTYSLANYKYATVLDFLYCKTDQGSVSVQIGNGTATSTARCTTSGVESTTKVNFSSRADYKMLIGSQTSNPNLITVTDTRRHNP